MVKNFVKRQASNLLQSLGYSIQKSKQVPLKTCSNDPREIPYLSTLAFSILQLPTERAINRNFSLCKETYNPFVLALQREFDNPQKQEEYAFNVLKKYTELVNFTSPNHSVGLDKSEGIFPDNNHPYQYTLPWLPLSPKEVKAHFYETFQRENLLYGLHTDEHLEKQSVSEEKIRMESHRLTSLYNSVKSQGYRHSDSEPIKAFVLVKNESWKWTVYTGTHRTAVLAALGYKSIPVYVKQIFRREEVDLWPGVQSGIYTRESALKVFDRAFDAQLPVMQDWIQYARTHLNNSD